MSEREQIVAWLLKRSTECRENADMAEYEDHERQWVERCETYYSIAKAIERGDHLPAQGTQP